MSRNDKNFKEELIQNIKDCGQSLIDNAEKIVAYQYQLINELTITCHVNEVDGFPHIEVNTKFLPENFMKRFGSK